MRPKDVDRLIAALAIRQHGVVSLAQLVELGLSPRAVSHRVAAGRLHRVHRGVFAVGHAALTREGRWMAAVLACGPGAALSHVSAAEAHRLLPGTTRVTDVAVPITGGRAPGAAIRPHRLTTLRPADGSRLGALPVTTPARTLLDLASVVAPRRLARAVEAFERRRLDFAPVHALLHAHRGQPGTAALRAALTTPPDGTASELEARLLELVLAHGLPRPQVNVLVGPFLVDFLWSRERLIAETDGHEHHGTRRAFRADRRRDATLHAAGYAVLRFTWADVVDDPQYVVGALRALLTR